MPESSAPAERPPSPPPEFTLCSGTPSTAGANVPYLEINPFGDVRLSVKAKNQSCDYRVVSQQIIAASHFFRQLLGPDSEFKEAAEFRTHRALCPFTLSITVDQDLKTCESVLRILHGQAPVGEVKPRGATIDDLYEIALLAQYFDCGGALTPWVLVTIPLLFDKDAYIGKISEVDKWVFMAYVLRLEAVFKDLTKFCIKNGHRCKHRLFHVYVKRDQYYDLVCTPQNVIDAILIRCRSLRNQFAEIVQNKAAEYKTLRRSGVCLKGERGCDMMVLGTLHYAIHEEQLVITTVPQAEWTSISTLERLVSKMDWHENLTIGYLEKYHDGHADCDPFDALQCLYADILDEEPGLDLGSFE